MLNLIKVLAAVVTFCVTLWSIADHRGFTEKAYQLIQDKYGPEARLRVSAWQQLMHKINSSGAYTELQKIREVNDFFNQVRWVNDIDHWKKEDYWATPVETLGTNAGDCEDFSIAKYFTLSEIGVDNDKLRITYVKALDYNQAHMVLAYYPSPASEPLILDNINKNIVPASRRTDLLPIYSFNAESLWLAKSRNKRLKADSQKTLPQWRQVNERMLQELL